MKTNQKSLIGDERGEIDIWIILVSIAIVLALVVGGHTALCHPVPSGLST